MRQPRRTFSARRMFGAASLLAIAAAAPAMAEQEAQSFEIPSQPLSEAIAEFARQANLDVIAPSALTRGKTSKPVAGEMEPQKALQLLMSDAALDVRRNDGGTLILVQAVTDVPKLQSSPTADPAPLPVTPRDPAEAADSQPTRATPLQRADRNDDEERTLGRVTVTGTLIRGLAPESSPLQIYSREDILGSGVTSTEQFIRTLPQNFGGGATELSNGFSNDVNSQRNNTFATGINLRGLGSGATLTLLDGNRLAPTSSIGDFVDLGMIPLTALSRIDVLTDGASSIYGGDAVAGVVNFVLRKDFKGAETSIKYGRVTQGSQEEWRFSQALGTAWRGGHLLATYEYYNRDALPLSDRPDIAAPLLFSGEAATNRESFFLLPSQERHSALLTGSQELSDKASVSATLLYANRDASSRNVTAAFSEGISRSETSSESWAFAFGTDYTFSPDWSITLKGNYSTLNNQRFSQTILPVPLSASENETHSKVWSGDLIVNGKLGDLAGGPVLAAFGGQYREEDFDIANRGQPALRDGARTVSAVFAEVALPIVGPNNGVLGVRRLEANVSARSDEYSDFGSTLNPKVGLLWEPVESFRFRGSYSESFAPPALGLAGALDRGAALGSYDWLRGLFGIPLPDPSLAGVNYLMPTGTSDNLDPETSRTFTGGFDFDRQFGRHGLSVRATYYDMDFRGRLGATPVPDNLGPQYAPGLAFQDPSLFPAGAVIFNPTDAQIQAVLNSLTLPLNFVGGATGVENVAFINSVAMVRNLARTKTRGLDLGLAYEQDTSLGKFTAGIDANHILSFSRQASPVSPEIGVLDTLNNPLSLRVRSRVGLSAGSFSGTLFLNHAGSYRTDDSADGRRIDDWATLDAVASYRPGPGSGRILEGLTVQISVLNLFDEMPPSTLDEGRFGLVGYDPANASPAGRFLSLELRKEF